MKSPRKKQSADFRGDALVSEINSVIFNHQKVYGTVYRSILAQEIIDDLLSHYYIYRNKCEESRPNAPTNTMPEV